MPGTAQGLDLAYGERWPCQPLAHLPCDTAKLWLISETVGSKVGCGQERHQRSGLGVWDSHPNRRDALPRCAGLRTCFFHGQQRELFPRSFPGHVYGPLLQQAEKAANISRPNATPPACARAKKVFSSFYKKCGNGFHGLSSLGTPETPPPSLNWEPWFLYQRKNSAGRQHQLWGQVGGVLSPASPAQGEHPWATSSGKQPSTVPGTPEPSPGSSLRAENVPGLPGEHRGPLVQGRQKRN